MGRQERREGPEMTVREAGKLGGEAVKAKYGLEFSEFYATIGRKGGRRVSEQRGPEFYSAIGQKGGASLKKKVSDKDPSYYSRIGKAGGEAIKEQKGPEYFSRIGLLGAKAKRERNT